MGTNVRKMIKYITKTKWKWAGTIARMKDDRWIITSQEIEQPEADRRDDGATTLATTQEHCGQCQPKTETDRKV